MAIELDNTFTVPVPPEHAWDVLLDVERIAPCMPGASVTSVEGDEITGQVKVKLGPLSLSYKGKAKFTDKDAENRAISIEATGKETRGAGTASATVQASLKPGDAEGSTLVSIHTSLNVTGRPAQFGRSLLPEVSGKLISQFATNLEALIEQDGASGGDAGAAADGSTASEGAMGTGSTTASGTATASEGAAAGTVSPVTATTPAKLPQQEESLNLIKLVGGPVLKRVLPIAAVAAVVAVLGKRLGRAFGKGKAKS
ncbi:MAG: SRPBCC family protein [Trebonia sp.]